MRLSDHTDEDRLGAMVRRRRMRAGRRIGLAGACVAVATLASATMLRADSIRPVYFFSNNSQPIDTHNRLVMKPSRFVLFLDGQWVLENLHWTGWDSAVARANGVSDSSDDKPNPASGKRIKTWADMTLSDPVRWHGHEVYSCFNILVPPPASDLGGCVLPKPPIGSGWLSGNNGGDVEFLAPGRRIWCELDATQATCSGYKRGQSLAVAPTRGATVHRTGKVVTCVVSESSARAGNGCAQNWDAAAPVLKLGQEVRAGGIVCRSERSGILCAIASGTHTRRGFLISGSTLRER